MIFLENIKKYNNIIKKIYLNSNIIKKKILNFIINQKNINNSIIQLLIVQISTKEKINSRPVKKNPIHERITSKVKQ